MTREVTVTVRLPGVRMVPTSRTCTCRHTRFANRGRKSSKNCETFCPPNASKTSYPPRGRRASRAGRSLSKMAKVQLRSLSSSQGLVIDEAFIHLVADVYGATLRLDLTPRQSEN